MCTECYEYLCFLNSLPAAFLWTKLWAHADKGRNAAKVLKSEKFQEMYVNAMFSICTDIAWLSKEGEESLYIQLAGDGSIQELQFQLSNAINGNEHINLHYI